MPVVFCLDFCKDETLSVAIHLGCGAGGIAKKNKLAGKAGTQYYRAFLRRGRIIRDRKLAFGFESSLLSIEHRDGTNEILLCGRPHPEAQRRARIEGAGCFAVPSLYLRCTCTFARAHVHACMRATRVCKHSWYSISSGRTTHDAVYE